MEFFTSTEFYCLAMVVAIALIGLLMGQSPPKPAETYITQLFTTVAHHGDDADMVTLSVMPDRTVLIARSGIIGAPDMGINLVAEVVGDKVKIVEKRASLTHRLGTTGEVPLHGTAQLRCFGLGHYSVRYESEITGGWALLSLSMVEGFARSVDLRL
ncbi:MAG: hypothetical protein KIG52_04980 [Muribaculaceae bacterium]|nr:hypothetical protein [Muribaculaceae bacterium]